MQTYRKPQLVKMKNCEVQFQCIHLQNIHTSKAQGTLQKVRRKDLRIIGIGSLCKNVSPRNVRSFIHRGSPT